MTEANESRPVVKCVRCGLVQFQRVQCLRCRALLPSRPKKESKPPATDRLRADAGLNAVAALLSFDDLPTLNQMERALMVAALQRSGRNAVEASVLIGVSKTTFYRKLREYAAAEQR